MEALEWKGCIQTNYDRRAKSARSIFETLYGKETILDNETANKILEQIARNSVAIDNLSVVITDLVKMEDRKLYTPMFKELVSSNLELGDLIGSLCPELNPMFLGSENFARLRQKYEDPNYPVVIPTQEEIDKSKKLWEKIQRVTKK